ncbi:hypothetical protein AAC387_Pa09g1303 [Persea americana]
MASQSLQFSGLRCPPLASSPIFKPVFPKPRSSVSFSTIILSAIPFNSREIKERKRLAKLFEEARDRCLTEPMKGVPFTLEDFHEALSKYDYDFSVNDKVKGTIFRTDDDGALVDIGAKSLAYLPVKEACIHEIKHVKEIGLYPGLQEEFIIIGQKGDVDFILSMRRLQYNLAWERCRQLHAENAVVKGKVVKVKKDGAIVIVEGLRGFVWFPQISAKFSSELLDKELQLKFFKVDEDNSKLFLRNLKAMAASHAQIEIGSVVTGTVRSLQPYGAFIDIGGIHGLLHINEISYDRISDVGTVLQPGDTLKVMILKHNRQKGELSLSTKKLEPIPGAMIRYPKLVFEKAEQMGLIFRKKVAQAAAKA